MRVSPENLKAIAQSGSATAMATALMNAARHIESLHQALIAEQELTERLGKTKSGVCTTCNGTGSVPHWARGVGPQACPDCNYGACPP